MKIWLEQVKKSDWNGMALLTSWQTVRGRPWRHWRNGSGAVQALNSLMPLELLLQHKKIKKYDWVQTSIIEKYNKM
jgi:hypothetical protein